MLLLVTAVGNGAMREAFIVPFAGGQAVHFVSTFILCAAIFVIERFSISWIKLKTGRETLLTFSRNRVGCFDDRV